MNFEFTEDQIALRDAAREAISRHRTEPVPGTAPHDGELWKALAELGALGLPFPEEAGGMGAGPVEAMVVALELGRAGVRTAYSETLTAAAMLGDDELFGAAVEGSRVVVPALFEPMRAWSPTPSPGTSKRAANPCCVTPKPGHCLRRQPEPFSRASSNAWPKAMRRSKPHAPSPCNGSAPSAARRPARRKCTERPSAHDFTASMPPAP